MNLKSLFLSGPGDENSGISNICRGMQIVNIALGGNLIQDLVNTVLEIIGSVLPETILIISISNRIVSLAVWYMLTRWDSQFCSTTKTLGKIANDLSISARSEDDVIEAIEYKDPATNPFLIGVQWHPERLYLVQDHQHFSQDIRSAFLLSVHQTKNKL